MSGSIVVERRMTSWRDVVEAMDYLMGRNWVFRGHERADWTLQTSLEREFPVRDREVEKQMYWHFIRTAPRLLPTHLALGDNDAAAWLGLIQHYGGPTRLLDVTRSPYVALYFAFEAATNSDRALWAIDSVWCGAACASIMASNEGINVDQTFARASAAQAEVIYSLVHGQPFPRRDFATFKPFAGVFPLDPWKPDSRQIAQQAMFLCAADATLSLLENLAAHQPTTYDVLYKFVLPASLRGEVIEQLSAMNVTAATLFPDLSGLARSLRTHTVRRTRGADAPAPWESKS
jgi:hypothetical protein